MTAFVQLDDYLRRVESRLRFFTAARGAALTAMLALFLTLLLAYICNLYRFAGDVVLPLRLLLFAVLGAAIAFALALPLRKLNRKRVTALAGQKAPEFGESLLTVTERPDTANPFTELIAEDALRIANHHGPDSFAEPKLLFGALGGAVVASGVLLWLIAAGPGFLGYGASLLWTGSGNTEKRPMYEVRVQPGNKTIRRKSDQTITAETLGFSAHQVLLHARYGDATKWDETPMQASEGNGYQFKFVGLADEVEYYVTGDGTESKHFKIAVKDLPSVKHVKVALHYPPALHLRDELQDPGGDIRAVQGTQADIGIQTDKPLDHGVIVMDNGTRLDLAKASDASWFNARLSVQKDGAYHVAVIDGAETIRISEDYFVEARKDEAPSVRIVKPGHDPHVSPIEEVPVTVEATDDFGVESLELHYSVNGGPDQVTPLLKKRGVKETSGSKLLTLEDFKMAPGDVVSLYATARDASHTARTEIIFAQAEPFDFKFSQSQQMGGGGGSMDQNDFSEKQKQIIAATWNEVRAEGKSPSALREDARFLADTQKKLADQAKTLAERMGSREMAGAGAEFAKFAKLLTDASQLMQSAASSLQSGKFQESLPDEQRALQALLKGDALFRDIQIAFGQRNGGGGGGGAQRDLARMLDLELDTSKNQYETAQNAAQQQQNEQQKAIQDAFDRLKELARRQQELATQMKQQQAFEQRWQEEQLRREAEELRRQMEQLTQNQQGMQSGQQDGQSSSGQSSSGQSSSSSQRTGQSAQQQQQQQQQQQREMAESLQRSADAIKRAEDQMRKAVSDRDTDAERRASQELQQAQSALGNRFQKQADQSTGAMAQRAQEMAMKQSEIANSLQQLYGGQRPGTGQRMRRPGQPEAGPNDLPEMRDPSMPYYYGYGRRRFGPDPGPPRIPTQKEQAIANEKERMARELRDLQTQMQQQEKTLAGTQPGAAAKMRKALSDAEQRELAMRMQKTAEFMMQGYGHWNLTTEQAMAQGLEQLSRDLQQVQKSVNEGDKGAPGGKQGEREAEALSQVRALRQMLERAQQQQSQRGQGQQQGGQQSGQQQGGQQPGQQPGGQQQSNQNPGSQWSPEGGGGPVTDGQSMRAAMQDLNAIRSRLDPHDPTLGGYVSDIANSLRLLNADPGKLDSTIGHDAVSRLERLEAELSKRTQNLQSEGARLRAPEDSPEKYRDAQAEYFRKLSQSRR